VTSPVRRLLALLTSDIGRQTLQRLGFGPATSPSQESV
jgi:hypothetical protein